MTTADQLTSISISELPTTTRESCKLKKSIILTGKVINLTDLSAGFGSRQAFICPQCLQPAMQLWNYNGWMCRSCIPGRQYPLQKLHYGGLEYKTVSIFNKIEKIIIKLKNKRLRRITRKKLSQKAFTLLQVLENVI